MLWGGADTLHIPPTHRIINRHLREKAGGSHIHATQILFSILLSPPINLSQMNQWEMKVWVQSQAFIRIMAQHPLPPGSVTCRNIQRHIFHLHHDTSRCTAAWLRWCARLAWWRYITLRAVLIPQATAWRGLYLIPDACAGWAFIRRRIWWRAGILLQSLELQQRALQAEAKHANEVSAKRLGWRKRRLRNPVSECQTKRWRSGMPPQSRYHTHSTQPCLTCVSKRGCVNVLWSLECCNSGSYPRLDYSCSGGKEWERKRRRGSASVSKPQGRPDETSWSNRRTGLSEGVGVKSGCVG